MNKTIQYQELFDKFNGLIRGRLYSKSKCQFSELPDLVNDFYLYFLDLVHRDHIDLTKLLDQPKLGNIFICNNIKFFLLRRHRDANHVLKNSENKGTYTFSQMVDFLSHDYELIDEGYENNLTDNKSLDINNQIDFNILIDDLPNILNDRELSILTDYFFNDLKLKDIVSKYGFHPRLSDKNIIIQPIINKLKKYYNGTL